MATSKIPRINTDFSLKAPMTNQISDISIPIIYAGGLVGLQNRSGQKGYRLQIGEGGRLALYKTTDGGQNWSEIKVIFEGGGKSYTHIYPCAVAQVAA